MIARLLARLLLVMLLPVAACSADDRAMRLPVDPQPLVITTSAGDVEFALEIADDDMERARGLMFRDDFPDDRAMIFVYPEEQFVAFWMQNTPLPLDMLFVSADGTIASIHEGAVPFSTDPIPSGAPVRFVIEIRAGLARSNGIAAGDKVSHPVIGG